jgi:predicted Zn-dependent peptidase
MRDDTPDDLVHDVFAGALFSGHPLGREIVGTQESVASMSRDAIDAYHRAHYRPENVVVAAAGNLDHDDVVAQVEEALVRRDGPRPPRASGADTAASERLSVLERPLEQAHVVLGTRALRRDDPDRFALGVLNQVVGGGMSSRLFQEVRERRGLAYSVFSYRSAYEETGSFAVYCGTGPERLDETLDVVRGELDRVVADGGIERRELDAAKGHLSGALSLSLETSSSRMHRIGRSELTLGTVPSLDDLVADIDAVTPDDVSRVVERVLAHSERTLAVVGPVGSVSV